MVNSSTRRSSDSRSGVQYAVDVEESMVDDTGAEIHKHGPPVQYTPRGSVNVHSLTELQRGRMSSVGSSPEAPEYFNCIDTGTVYRFLVNDNDDTCCGLFVAMATATVQIIVYALLLLMIVVRGEGEDMCGDVEMAEGCDVMTVVGSNDNDTMTMISNDTCTLTLGAGQVVADALAVTSKYGTDAGGGGIILGSLNQQNVLYWFANILVMVVVVLNTLSDGVTAIILIRYRRHSATSADGGGSRSSMHNSGRGSQSSGRQTSGDADGE